MLQPFTRTVIGAFIFSVIIEIFIPIEKTTRY